VTHPGLHFLRLHFSNQRAAAARTQPLSPSYCLIVDYRVRHRLTPISPRHTKQISHPPFSIPTETLISLDLTRKSDSRSTATIDEDFLYIVNGGN
jgi:hypothetical protein